MAEQMSKVKVTNLVLGTMIVRFELPLSLIDDINKLSINFFIIFLPIINI